MKMLDLFSGIGGISLAAEWTNAIETVAFCEIEPFCQKVLKKHWPDVPIFDDVKKLNRQALIDSGVLHETGTIDIVAGGFPCQPFSIAGKRKGKEDDRDLWPEMFRIISEIKPTWVVGENVANFVNMELERTLIDLENEGYETQTFVIPACGVNAKHQRYRTFVVAYTDSKRNDSEKEYRVDRDRTKDMQEWKQSQCKPTDKIKTYVSRSTWRDEPGVGRMVDGLSNRLDRCRSLGNAVVPQQIYPIFEAIMRISHT